MKYMASLDGMRAIAITSVVFYHFTNRIEGGFIGVDIFFVLSGFLISTILLNEIKLNGTVCFKRFYYRRALRLFPALICMLLALTVLALASAHHRTYQLEDIALSAIYAMNWNRAFGWVPGDGGFLGHMWSLSIEEQFYLIWPLAMLLLARIPRIWIVFACGIVLETIWRSYLVHAGAPPERTYNGFDVHSDTLLIGCTLALMNIGPGVRKYAAAFAVIPVGLLLLLLFTLELQANFTRMFGCTTAGLCAAWLLIAAMEDGWFRTILSVRPLVYTGKISYGWYLWHYPISYAWNHLDYSVLTAARNILPGQYEKFGLIIGSYLIAMVSHHFVERPFLRLKDRTGLKSNQGRLTKDEAQAAASV